MENLVLYFVNDEIFKKFVSMGHFVYQSYLLILLYIFPAFVAYLSICLLVMINNLKKKLEDTVAKNTGVEEHIFNQIIQNVNKLNNLVKIIDDVYS